MNETHEDAGPSTKKARTSHHKHQMPAYCYCGKCQGRVKQKPRTIDDHRTRYPRQQLIQPEVHRINELSGEAREPLDGADNGILNPDDQFLSLLTAGAEQSPPGSPVDSNVPCAPLEHPSYSSEILVPSASRGLLSSPTGSHASAEFSNSEKLLDVPPEEYQEYSFDQLLNEDDYRQGFRLFHDLELHDELEYDVEINDEFDPDGILYDEDFGLPNDEGSTSNPSFQESQFEFEEDLEVRLNDEDDNIDDNDSESHCAAFQEPELIRNAYIDAFIQKSLYGATHRALNHQLRAARRSIATHPSIQPEDLANMAQTIGTAEKRLGVDYARIITQFTLCPACKRLHTPEYIAEADSSTCLNENCPGILFTTRKLASGSQRRVSGLTYPFASPIAWIRRMVNLAGMAEMMQNWRNEDDDQIELAAPVSSEEWMNNLDPHKPIGDICEGWGWRSTQAGLERRQDSISGNVVDESTLNPPVRFVGLPFGLSLSLNTDWFQTSKEGNYSIGACYLVINNLPRHMRFLRENVSLCLLMPGPNEPNDYALDQMLGPLINELLELKQGVRMTVRRGDPPVYQEEVVYAELTQHIADLIARIKIGGGAGVKSELNFCLYCHMRLSFLSVPAGYTRRDFEFRNPHQERNNVYQWKSLPTIEERRALFSETGNRFTALHWIPGWHTCTSSPPDAMHLLYLGAMNWIVKQVLVGPGMFSTRRNQDQDPREIFNDCLDRMWMPKNFQRLPPKLGQTRTSIKADQWKLTSRILYIPLYLAFRDGDEIGPGYVPRGNRSSPAAKHQNHRAKLLHQQRKKYFQAIGQPNECPPIEECYASRSLRFHYRQVLRFCLAVNIIDKRSITPHEIQFAQQLLESLCIDYTRNNVQLPPNFHYMMHLEEFMLKLGSLYNTHVWGMERANGIVSRINHNGKGHGVLEGTLMRGWWSYTTVQNLIAALRLLPNRTPADDEIIQELTTVIRGGTEQAQQRGTLMSFIVQCQTAYARLHGVQDPTRLSTQSRMIDLEKHSIYALVLQFCIATWPDAGIFGPGMPRQHYLAPSGMVRNHSYVEHDGIRYGAWEHTSGKGYCYGYIDGRNAVRIDRILHITFPGTAMSTVCALVRLFQLPPIEGRFPWDAWAGHLGVSSWAYDTLGELTAIPVQRFSGTLALFDILMSYGRYWVTVALDSVSPERDNDEVNDD